MKEIVTKDHWRFRKGDKFKLKRTYHSIIVSIVDMTKTFIVYEPIGNPGSFHAQTVEKFKSKIIRRLI